MRSLNGKIAPSDFLHKQLDVTLPQLFVAFFPHNLISFLHDGPPFLRLFQPDSIRTGHEDRRSAFNGNQDTFLLPGHRDTAVEDARP